MSGYTRIPATLAQMTLMNTLVAIREDLGERTSTSGLVMLEKQATTVGRVLAVGDKVKEDIRAGDLVLYEMWQGGRWQLGDDKMLIMDIDKVLAVIRRFPSDADREGIARGVQALNEGRITPWEEVNRIDYINADLGVED